MPATPAVPGARAVPGPGASVAVGAAAFLIYALLCPSVAADKDSGEFTLVLATLGLAHPTGYPLYTLIGHPFAVALHALGMTWPRAANTFSALGGGVAVGALHALVTRLWPARAGARAASALALLPVGAFLLDPVWTFETTLAEINSWHVAWAAVAALVAWHADRALEDPRTPARAVRRQAFGWGLVLGAGVAHHATFVFPAAPFTLLLLVRLAARARDRASALLAGIAGTLVPAASIAYVAWRATHPALVQWPELGPRPGDVLDHLGGAQYRQFLGHFTPSPAQAALLVRYVYPWLVPGAAAACAAPFLTLPGTRGYRLALAAATLAQTVACFAYGVPDPSSYFLPPLLFGFALLGPVLAALVSGRAVARTAVAAAALGVAALAVQGARVAVQRNATYAQLDTLLRRMWDSLPDAPGFVVWSDDMNTRLRIYQLLEGDRAALEVVHPAHLTHPLPRLRFAQRHGFDPVAGLDPLLAGRAIQAGDTLRARALEDGIVDRLNRATPLPVYRFLPEVPSVRRLRKPDAVRTPGPSSPG